MSKNASTGFPRPIRMKRASPPAIYFPNKNKRKTREAVKCNTIIEDWDVAPYASAGMIDKESSNATGINTSRENMCP